MKKEVSKKFYMSDKYGDMYVFVGNSEQIEEIQNMCMSREFVSNAVRVEDELGIFCFPFLQGLFTPNEDGDYIRPNMVSHFMKYQMPGFRLEFVDEDGIPYFSTCDGLKLWRKEYLDWYEQVIEISNLINDIKIQMMATSKSEIRRLEKVLECQNKKLNDMDFDCLEVFEVCSPIKIYRHVRSSCDMARAFEEIYARNRRKK